MGWRHSGGEQRRSRLSTPPAHEVDEVVFPEVKCRWERSKKRGVPGIEGPQQRRPSEVRITNLLQGRAVGFSFLFLQLFGKRGPGAGEGELLPLPGFPGCPAFCREPLPAWPLPEKHPVRRSVHLALLSRECSTFQSLRPFLLGPTYQWLHSGRIPFALCCSLCTVFIFLPSSVLQQQLNSP